MAAASVTVEQTYSTPDRHHNQMEPHVTLAALDEDGTLTLYDTTHHIYGANKLVAMVLRLPPEKVTVANHFLGGRFGGKTYVWPHTHPAGSRNAGRRHSGNLAEPALATGSLAVVQPVSALELPLALVIGGVVFHVHRSRTAWISAAGITVGLTVFLMTSAASGSGGAVMAWPSPPRTGGADSDGPRYVGRRRGTVGIRPDRAGCRRSGCPRTGIPRPSFAGGSRFRRWPC
ncbi:molybdopterin cofactor-binding domain-containing protein [Streptomyces sp. S1D4-11]